MNISMLDMHNLCWKINLVEKGMADPLVVLPTYEIERRDIAQQLIRFDAEYSRLFSGRSPNATELTDDPVLAGKKTGAVDAQKFIEVSLKVISLAVCLTDSILNRSSRRMLVSQVVLEQFTPNKVRSMQSKSQRQSKVSSSLLASVSLLVKSQEQWMRILSEFSRSKCLPLLSRIAH